MRYLSLLVLMGVVSCDNEPVAVIDPPAPPATTMPLYFSEAAAGLSVDFMHETGAVGGYRFPEIMGSGVAVADLDGDNDLDLVAIQGEPDGSGRHRVFLNRLVETGQLHFEDASRSAGLVQSAYGMGVAAADIDNDGDTDLLITHVGANVLFINGGNGVFEPAPDFPAGTAWSTSASFADIDNDGWLDLFVANYVDFFSDPDKVCDSVSGRRDYCHPSAYPALADQLLRNNGDGTFTDISVRSGIGAVRSTGLGVVASDFDGNGLIDFYVANDGLANHLWINLGDGRFSEHAVAAGAAYNDAGAAEAGMGVVAADIDADGDADVVVTHLRNETNTLYINSGNSTFTDRTLSSGIGPSSRRWTGFGLSLLDYDHDGLHDLFIANGAVAVSSSLQSDAGYTEPDLLLHNLGGARFADVSGALPNTVAVSRGVASGDLDNDGDIDLVVADAGAPLRILLNNATQSPSLMVTIEGTDSNRDGLGTRLTLQLANGTTLVRYVQTDGSYLSANDRRVHFGLGSQGQPVTLRVDWPSGRTEQWGDLQKVTMLRLVEGDGTAVRKTE